MANDTEKRITAKMVLDSTGFNSSLQGVNQQLKLAQSELKASSAQVGVFGTETDKLKVNSEGLSKQIELQRQKVDIYKDSIEKSTQKLQESIKARDTFKTKLQEETSKYNEAVKVYGKESEEALKAKESVDKLTEEYKKKEKQVESTAKSINNYTANMNKADAELAKMQGELSKTTNELNKSNNSLLQASEKLKVSGEHFKDVGEKASGAGDKILKLTAPLVGVGIVAAKVGMDFESQMSRVKAISGATEEEFEKLNNQAIELGASTAFSAKEAAEGMENLASAGFTTTEIMKAMPGMLDLAASSGEDLASSADIAASTLRGFGLEADKAGHVADVLAKNASATNAAVADTGEAMKYVAPVAKAMGLSLEEVTASIGLMANAGIKGSQAGTTLRGALSRLADPSKEAAGAMKQIGFSAFDSHGKLLPLEDIIDRLQKSTKSLTDKQKEQAISTIFGQEAMSGMLTLVSAGPQQLDELTKSLKNSDGAAKNMAQTMQDNAKSSVEQMMGSLETAGIKIEQAIAPTIRKVADTVGNLADNFAKLSPETQEATVKFVALSVGLGTVLKVGGGVVSSVGGIIGAVGKLSGAIGTATVATEGIGTAATVAAGAGGIGGLAGLGTALGGIAIAAAPWLIAGAAVVGTGYAINKAMSEEAVPAVNLFADKVNTTSKQIETAHGTMATQIETDTVKISQATQKAVGAYIKMDDDVTKTMTNLYVTSSQITTDTSTSLTTKFNDMGTQIKIGLDNKYNDMYSIMQTFFKDSGALSDAEEAEALAKLKQNNEFQKSTVDQGVKEIKAILDKASKEKRELTAEERSVIGNIQDNMKQDAIKSLSETEVESKVIMERLKGYSERITAEQAADTIKKANETRDKAVAAANDQYDKTVATIIKMRDESHSITSEQAEMLLKNATKQKDDSITKANEMHDGVVKKIKDMNPDIEKEVNLQTGTIMNGWDKLKTWWNNLWFPKKTMEVETVVIGNNTVKDTAAGWNTSRMNYTGNTNFEGGFTTLHEKGYEVYDLPRGTRIYNHEASEDMVLKTAEAVARRITDNNTAVGNSGINVTQHIYLPTPSPSELARQTKNSLRELGLRM